ncbi:DUF3843 family protein [uncultured Muribaculum sp.]|uniref:DUF3843 family protein n=1 Tax=uncultured Muribaculum sp. TaxID=1918613 RepID=UPI00272BF0A8|nr:DUF3843 family protein [uncultured Muribaculum sp.]
MAKQIRHAGFVTRLEFSNTHYMALQLPTDMFYVSVANRLIPVIKKSLREDARVTDTVAKQVALRLTCYLEDLVAGTGVWAAFVRLCKQKYGYALPFYKEESEECLACEPTEAGISFLLWSDLNLLNPQTVLVPLTQRIIDLAGELYPILISAYENAHETEMMAKIHPDQPMPVVYQVRNLCYWLLSGSYLTGLHDPLRIMDMAGHFFSTAMASKGGAAPDFNKIRYAVDSYIPFNVKIGPLGLLPQEWLAAMMECRGCEDDAKFADAVKELRSIPYSFYLIKEISPEKAVVENFDGKELTLSPLTMPEGVFPSYMKVDTVSYASIIYFEKSWIINGVAVNTLEREVFENARKEWKGITEDAGKQFEEQLKKNNGSRIGVCSSIDEYQKIFGIGDDQLTDAQKKMKSELQNCKNILYFINSGLHVEILPDLGDCISIPGNELYSSKGAKELIMVFDKTLASEEFREYIVENKLIPAARLKTSNSQIDGHALLQDNLPFFIDNIKEGNIDFVVDPLRAQKYSV